MKSRIALSFFVSFVYAVIGWISVQTVPESLMLVVILTATTQLYLWCIWAKYGPVMSVLLLTSGLVHAGVLGGLLCVSGFDQMAKVGLDQTVPLWKWVILQEGALVFCLAFMLLVSMEEPLLKTVARLEHRLRYGQGG